MNPRVCHFEAAVVLLLGLSVGFLTGCQDREKGGGVCSLRQLGRAKDLVLYDRQLQAPDCSFHGECVPQPGDRVEKRVSQVGPNELVRGDEISLVGLPKQFENFNNRRGQVLAVDNGVAAVWLYDFSSRQEPYHINVEYVRRHHTFVKKQEVRAAFARDAEETAFVQMMSARNLEPAGIGALVRSNLYNAIFKGDAHAVCRWDIFKFSSCGV